jgi:Leucine-rich repeat (LRR) protein
MRTKITDAGLKHLRTLTKLKTLNLSGTEVTDAGLTELRELKSLTYLNLLMTRVRPESAGLKALKESLPHAKILR